MNILVSSPLDGRDSALLKSMLNLRKEYGDLSIKYTEEPAQSSLSICKDCEENETRYYAVLTNSKKNIPILPTLNPTSINSLFHTISQPPVRALFDDSNFKTQRSLIFQIYEFINSEPSLRMHIQYSGLQFVLDIELNLIFSTEKMDKDLFVSLLEKPEGDFKIYLSDVDLKESLSHECCLSDFMWEVGFLQPDSVLDPKFLSPEYVYKQVSWPDYGRLPFTKEFIPLSSSLWQRAESYDNLVKRTGFKEGVINQFLNSLCLSKHMVIIHSENNEHTPVKIKKSKFLVGLRRLFTIG